MSEVQKQIERNRKDAAIQKMNSTLVADDPNTTVVGQPKKAELPLYGEDVQKVVQKLKKEAERR